MNQATVKKIEQVRNLLKEIDKELSAYTETAGPEGGRLDQAQRAARWLNETRSALTEAGGVVYQIVDRCEREAGREPGGLEAVQVEIIIEPRFRDSYRETVELEIPSGLTGNDREKAIEDAAADTVNEECPWGAQEVTGS